MDVVRGGQRPRRRGGRRVCGRRGRDCGSVWHVRGCRFIRYCVDGYRDRRTEWAAATNAALAMLGGGALAAGGAGVAGGTAVLAGIVAAPALLLAVGGLLWMVKRNRKQQEEIKAKLDAAEAEIADSQRVSKLLSRFCRARQRSWTTPLSMPDMP